MDIKASAKLGVKRIGRAYLLKHYYGKKLTQQEAIRAKCYECDGMGDTGLCNIAECPLYPFSQFKENK